MNVPNRYKGFSRLPENVQQKMDPSLARKYENGGEAESRSQQIINKAVELFGDASESSIMKVIQMLGGLGPGGAAMGSSAGEGASEMIQNIGSAVGKAAQTVGGYTLAPYIAKGMGFDRAANALGLPYDDEGNMIPGRMPKYPPENKADGGAVMQRPLFRNMGGPAAPMPQDMAMQAPPPMAPPPPPAGNMGIAALQEAEMSGEQMGMRAADQTMQNIDGAQDYEALIDGIRGNQMPIEARYQELAGMVGEQDAMATPESVLTLTQPTIMLTEQGAMDSGIGELIQGLSGETEMSGPMEEGVGSLMAAGAGNTPPVNFRDGGPVEVRNFKNGTPAEGNLAAITKSLYPQMKDLYAGILGDPAERAAQLDEQKRLTQAQMLFDIAGTALNFAGNTQGSTAAERLANAASQTQLFDKIGQRAAGQLQAKQAQKAEERQLNMAALTGAMGEGSRQLTAEAARALAAAKRAPVKPSMYYYKLKNGNLKAFDVANNYQEFKKYGVDNPTLPVFEVGTEGKPLAASIKEVHYFGTNNQFTKTVPFNVNTEAGIKDYQTALTEKGAKSQEAAEPLFAALKEAAKLSVTGRPTTFVRATAPFTLREGKENQRDVGAGEVLPLNDLQIETFPVTTYDSNANLVQVFKRGQPPKILIQGPNFEKELNALGEGWSLTRPEMNLITMQLVNADESVTTEQVDASTPKGLKRADELLKLGYLAENDEAKQLLIDEMAQRVETREQERSTKTEIVFRTFTDSETGEQRVMQKEMPVGTTAGASAYNALLKKEAEEGYSKWTSDSTLRDAILARAVKTDDLFLDREGTFQEVELDRAITVNGIFYPKGIQLLNENDIIAIQALDTQAISKDFISNKDVYLKTGFLPSEIKMYQKQDPETYKFIRGLPSLTNKDYFDKFGMTKEKFESLATWQVEQRLGIDNPVVKYATFTNSEDGDQKTVDVSTKDGRAVVQALIDDGYIESGSYEVPVTEKTTGFVTTKPIVVDGQEIPKGVFVELNPTQLENLADPSAVRRQLTGVAKTLMKKGGETLVVTITGGNFYGPDGNYINLNSAEYKDAQILGENNSFETAKKAKSQAEASERLGLWRKQYLRDTVDGPRFQGGNKILFQDFNGKSVDVGITANSAASTVDLASAIENGVGPWAKVRRLGNRLAGLTPKSWGFQMLGLKTVEATAYVDALNISLRVALASNPRLAEGEQVRLNIGLPSTDRFLENPKAGLTLAMVARKRLAIEYEKNLIALAAGTMSTSKEQQAKGQNFAIETFFSLMQALPEKGLVDDAAVQSEVKRRLGAKR